MQILLTFDDLSKEAERCLIEWLQEKINIKSPEENRSPLRFVKEMRVLGTKEEGYLGELYLKDEWPETED